MDLKERPTYSPSNYILATNSSSEMSKTQMKSAMQKKKAGRKKFQETRHPIYKGVRQRNGKWVCELRQPQKKSRVWMGTFACPEMAARAYDVAAFAFKGDLASLNFPELTCSIPIVKPSSVDDLRCPDAMENAKEISSHVQHISSCPDLFSLEMASEASTSMYVDEEELFNMPSLLDSMAEGLMLTPPTIGRGFDWDDFDDSLDVTLWSN